MHPYCLFQEKIEKDAEGVENDQWWINLLMKYENPLLLNTVGSEQLIFKELQIFSNSVLLAFDDLKEAYKTRQIKDDD
jgi:hypothetical protein